MRLCFFPLLLPFLDGFTEANASSSTTVLETRITTIVIPAAHTSSEVANALSQRSERSLSKLGTGLDNDDLKKRQAAPTSFPSIHIGMESSTTSATSVAGASEVPGWTVIEPCFNAGSPCFVLFNGLQTLFSQKFTKLEDPNNMTASRVLQHAWCVSNESSREPGPLDRESIDKCDECLQKEPQSTKDNWASMQDLMFNFCASQTPSLYLLLLGFNRFYSSEAPSNYKYLNQNIRDIPNLSTKFHDSPELNSATVQRPTSRTSQASTTTTTTTTDGATTSSPSAPGRTTTSHTATGTSTDKPPPTSRNATGHTNILEQLPSSWPYTAYALARRPGSTITSTLTAEAGEPATVVLAAVQWYPRPIDARNLLADYSYNIASSNAAGATPKEPSLTPTRSSQGSS